MYLQRAAGQIALRGAVAISTDVLDVVARIWRIVDTTILAGDAVALVVAWLDHRHARIGETVLAGRLDLDVASGRAEMSAHVSYLGRCPMWLPHPQGRPIWLH
ncbi:hypothetical protein QPR87_16360 [Paracoccus sp. SSJ]|nr:hypothetical protein [Paracoccus sp. SSJ]